MQKNSFVIKICVLIDIENRTECYLPRCIIRWDKNKGSVFFQAVFDDAILHVAFLYSWADSQNGYLIYGKDNVWENN